MEIDGDERYTWKPRKSTKLDENRFVGFLLKNKCSFDRFLCVFDVAFIRLVLCFFCLYFLSPKWKFQGFLYIVSQHCIWLLFSFYLNNPICLIDAINSLQFHSRNTTWFCTIFSSLYFFGNMTRFYLLFVWRRVRTITSIVSFLRTWIWWKSIFAYIKLKIINTLTKHTDWNYYKNIRKTNLWFFSMNAHNLRRNERKKTSIKTRITHLTDVFESHVCVDWKRTTAKWFCACICVFTVCGMWSFWILQLNIFCCAHGGCSWYFT